MCACVCVCVRESEITPILPAQMQRPMSAQGVEFDAHPILSPP